MVYYVYADLCSLLAATSQCSVFIGRKMRLTGCHYGNGATCDMSGHTNRGSDSSEPTVIPYTVIA